MPRSRTAGAAAARQAAVAESLHLVRFPPGTTEDDVSQLLDGIWSLQYMVAGPICGSAGPLSPPLSRFGPCDAGPDAATAFTHAVLFRYSNEAALRRFEGQPRVQLMLGGSGAPAGTAIATLNFLGSVPNELEAIFRRGSEWEAGLELAAGLALQAGASEGDADEFLSLTQQLALSAAFGAVQCSYGRCLAATHTPLAEAAAGQLTAAPSLATPDYVLLARFQDEQLLRNFLECPPLAALLEGDDRLPLHALWSCALETCPSDSSSSRAVSGGLM